MCSNDLSFVLGSSHLPGRASGITCESDRNNNNEGVDAADGVST